jgi:hypothetical protein
MAARGIATGRRYNAPKQVFPGVYNIVGYKPETTLGFAKDLKDKSEQRKREKDALAEKYLRDAQVAAAASSGVGSVPQLSEEEQEQMNRRLAAIARGQRYDYPKKVDVEIKDASKETPTFQSVYGEDGQVVADEIGKSGVVKEPEITYEDFSVLQPKKSWKHIVFVPTPIEKTKPFMSVTAGTKKYEFGNKLSQELDVPKDKDFRRRVEESKFLAELKRVNARNRMRAGNYPKIEELK